jgi:hypothetical protein
MTTERERRRVKQRICPAPGFERFRNAVFALTGIGLAQKIRKGQFDTSAVIGRGGARVVPHVWEAGLAA